MLPDAAFLKSAAEAFDKYASELDDVRGGLGAEPSDAMTALVVMVPTMSEYFGQWKESRFVLGDAADAESFNVVSRLSDVGDILTGLEVIYDGVQPASPRSTRPQSRADRQGARRPARVRRRTSTTQEQAGKRFTPEQAETLGAEAQERATAIAGQVSQPAAELEITIEQ